MLQFDLSAQERSSFGKSASKKLRKSGYVPAILYGTKIEPKPLKFVSKDLEKVLLKLQRRNALFNIDIAGDSGNSKRHVMVKELQTNPVNDTLVHADFCEVPVDQPIVLEVPVHYKGVAKGVELGGELVVSVPTATVRGCVLDIPDYFEVDVSSLVIGKRFNCEVIEVPDNVELLNSKDDICVSVQTAKKVEIEDEEEEEVSEEEGGSEEETASE